MKKDANGEMLHVVYAPTEFIEVAKFMGIAPEMLAYQLLTQFAQNPPESISLAWKVPTPEYVASIDPVVLSSYR